jgi:hypothetical protein
MSYGLSFLSITATITHAIIHFWKPIQLRFTRSVREQPDIHAELMDKYPQGILFPYQRIPPDRLTVYVQFLNGIMHASSVS